MYTLGHGADVLSVDWHPRKSLVASGSKDSQQPVKLWDPKAGQSVATMLVPTPHVLLSRSFCPPPLLTPTL